MGKDILDEIMNETIKFMDEKNNLIELKAGDVYRVYCPKEATPEQLLEFKMKVEGLGLDPRRGEVWMALFPEYDNGRKTGEKVVILTSYQVYLKRAQGSEKLAGHRVEIEKHDSDNPLDWEAKFLGKRTDMEQEYETPLIPVKELSKKRGLWNIMPTVMTTIRMESLGMRWMMADVLGGMPWTAEEIRAGASDADIDAIHQNGQNQEDIEKELQAKEQAKNEFLSKLASGLKEITIVGDLEEQYKKNKKKYNASELKDNILAVYEERKYDLSLSKLAELTGFDIAEVAQYANKEMMQEPVIQEALAGNNDAVKQVASDITAYLAVLENSLDATIDEVNETLFEEATEEHKDPTA